MEYGELLGMKTAILGGGLTGITLARLLHEKGEEMTVLEREPDYGGLCRSMSESGFTFDRGGSHIIFSRDAEVLKFMNDILGGNKQLNHRNTKVFYKGQCIKYPFENGLNQLPKEDLFFCINEFINNLVAFEKGLLTPPENFREWIIHTFGKGIADLYLIPYNEKIWKFPTEKMSLHWVYGRIPRPPVEDIIKSAIGIETEGYTHQAVFSYPLKGGIEELVKSIAAPVEKCIRTGFEVSSVRKEGEKYVINDGSSSIIADRCISTIPLQKLLGSLENVPERVRKSCNDLKYNSIACVFIGVRRKLQDISWMYVPDKDLGLFNRISFPSNYSPYVAPAGHSAILAEITYHEGDDVSRMPDQMIIAHVIKALGDMNIIMDMEDIVYTALERHGFAYVIYDLDYKKNIAIVKDFCGKLGIGLVGRFSEFEYLNMDGCIRSAMDYVRNRR